MLPVCPLGCYWAGTLWLVTPGPSPARDLAQSSTSIILSPPRLVWTVRQSRRKCQINCKMIRWDSWFRLQLPVSRGQWSPSQGEADPFPHLETDRTAASLVCHNDHPLMCHVSRLKTQYYKTRIGVIFLSLVFTLSLPPRSSCWHLTPARCSKEERGIFSSWNVSSAGIFWQRGGAVVFWYLRWSWDPGREVTQ